jgi:ATP-dependent helicase/nuclease subunit A
MMERLVSDSTQRRRAVEETDRSFVVEASAGTGKTSILIDRILHLVLEKGPGGPPLPLSGICAITFTEKAAGEMKIRLREKFEVLALEPGPRGDLARAAISDLETAAISTFHAFAVALLKERPVEAELDPRFSTLDETQSDLLFREIWEPWIHRAIDARHPTLERALRHGISLDILRNLAQIVRLHARSVRELGSPAPATEEEMRAQMDIFWLNGKGLLELCRNPDDKLLSLLQNALQWLKNPGANAAPAGKPGNKGAAGSWKGARETVETVRGFINEVIEFSIVCTQLPSQRIFDEALRWMIAEFLPDWENGKRIRGVVDFDDQLRMARDLLMRSRAARSEFQNRFAALLVDEFQDTDPLQLHIVLLLSATDPDQVDPTQLKPGPGRLFIVGDPKQSIYRFRNADIETYMGIIDPGRMKELGSELLQLNRNFRSVPSILRFVDEVFQDSMAVPEDGRYQPAYLAFGGQGERPAGQSHPAVYFLTDRNTGDVYSRRVEEYFGREAVRIARLISQIPNNENWMVHERSELNNQGWRLPTFGDIAILLPVMTKADMLEDALRNLDIPYVLEGGKYYYTRSEVSSAITLLRSIADPNDTVALYGTLRSIFFGLSDEDMLRARIEGRPLDYRCEVPFASPLYLPYQLLRNLHCRRHERPAAETFEDLLHRTGAREVLAARGFQSLANLGKLTRKLRSLQKGTSFSQVASLLQTMDEEGLAESESRLMEQRSDAVRIMSIHRAKGLDFPIVFVAGLGLRKTNRTGNFLADCHRKKAFAVMIESKEPGLKTPLWKELAEEDKKREDAELLRLLYVALTRARDHLVLCAHSRGFKKPAGQEEVVPDIDNSRLKPFSPFLCNLGKWDGDMIRVLDGEALDGREGGSAPEKLSKTLDRREWVAQEIQELRRLIKETPFSKNLRAPSDAAGAISEEDSILESRDDAAARPRAIRFGIAFHAAMEEADIDDQDGVLKLAQDIGARYGLGSEEIRLLENMARRTLASELLERARKAANAGGRVLKELPFIRPVLNGGSKAIEEGKIDLAFEEKGGWVLVDYKTDRIPQESRDLNLFFQEKYAAQMRHYAAALHDLKAPVKSVYLLLARTGTAIEIR